jgi:hypothetical protein
MDQNSSHRPDRRSGDASGFYSYMDMVAKEAEEYAAGHTTAMSALLEEIEHFTLTKTSFRACSPGGLKDRSCSSLYNLRGAADR